MSSSTVKISTDNLKSLCEKCIKNIEFYREAELNKVQKQYLEIKNRPWWKRFLISYDYDIEIYWAKSHGQKELKLAQDILKSLTIGNDSRISVSELPGLLKWAGKYDK